MDRDSSLICWRIVREPFAPSAFDGEGARRFGGRWNSPGTPMVYTSETIALAALEILVNLESPELLRERFVVLRAEIPADIPVEILNSLGGDAEAVTIDQISASTEASEISKIREGMATPARHRTRAVGDAWCARNSAVALIVPSAVVPQERNILLNPRHPHFNRVRVAAPTYFWGLPRYAKDVISPDRPDR